MGPPAALFSVFKLVYSYRKETEYSRHFTKAENILSSIAMQLSTAGTPAPPLPPYFARLSPSPLPPRASSHRARSEKMRQCRRHCSSPRPWRRFRQMQSSLPRTFSQALPRRPEPCPSRTAHPACPLPSLQNPRPAAPFQARSPPERA